MSFQTDKSQLENSFDVLKQQALSTSENWGDQVQRKFYDQFINSLPKEFFVYITELDKLDKLFEATEQHLNYTSSDLL